MSSTTKLHTKRLLLRVLEPSDAPALLALFDNPKNNGHIPQPANKRTTQQMEEKIISCRHAADDGISLFFSVFLNDGTLIGTGGMNSINKETDVGDAGIMIDAQYWRQGYALEALSATLEWAFGQTSLKKVELETAMKNLAMRGLLEKKYGINGEEKDGEVKYVIEKSDWEQISKRLGPMLCNQESYIN